MHPRRTRRDTKEEERLESLLRDGGALEYDGMMERPAWAKVRERLEIAPRRRSIVAPALVFGVVAALIGFGVLSFRFWGLDSGAQGRGAEKHGPPMMVKREPLIHDTQPQPPSPKPKFQPPKPKTRNPKFHLPSSHFIAQTPKPTTQNRQPKTDNSEPPPLVVVARTYAPGGYTITTTWEGNVQTTVTTCTQPRQPAFFVVRTAYPSPQPPAQRDEGITIKSASILPTVIRSSDALTRQTVISAQPLEAAEEKTEVRPLLQQKLSLNLSASAETGVTEGGIEE